ncbi:hypothetical protein EVJ58_g5747 [Rhodofomes roseus]|uniref:Helicase ATP-binding domain-containing protein n=1 Tax=Rhodofomes roseus TaxID=34475 RepID=A0A4Y9YAY8_9APHY|nr:hypothetical protein EVJ58_g5747 [Rhodofomes roseus]
MQGPDTQGPSSPSFTSFSSPDGIAFCRNIASKSLPWDPHDYQLEGACKALDGIDVFAITPTGSGKTGFLLVYILVAQAIANDPALCPGALRTRFKADPCMLVFCPTKALEHDMEPKFQAAGLSTLVINANTTKAAAAVRRDGNLWKVGLSKKAVILLSPEQLATPGFFSLINDPSFAARIMALNVDEAHLLDSWGAQFRPLFREIGNVRARLPGNPILIALTATICPGPQTKTVMEFFGMRQCHVIRRSNARYDVRWIFRTTDAGPTSREFPELDWVLEGDRRVIIFCETISFAHRILSYLRRKAKHLPGYKDRVRVFTSISSESYVSKTLE